MKEKNKRILVVIATITLVLVAAGCIVSGIKANNEKQYYAKKQEVIAKVEQGNIASKLLYEAYEELIDVATSTELPVEDSFFEVKQETIDIHVLTTQKIYKVVPIVKPSKEEVLTKIKKEAVGLLKEYLNSRN